MFIDNLSQERKTSYEQFVFSLFKFTPITQSAQGHLNIKIKDSEGETFNLADLGFGYSQILPIITMLWYYSTGLDMPKFPYDNKRQTATILIEQPELHLHPAMQAELADAFIFSIKEARKNKVRLNIMIETHSPVIINRIGRRIYEEKINPDMVSVSLFEVNENMHSTDVRTVKFNAEGVLEEWPLGFFEPKL